MSQKSHTSHKAHILTRMCSLLLEYVLLLSPPHVAQGAHTACLPGLFPIARLDAKRNRKKKQITFLQGVYSLPCSEKKREKRKNHISSGQVLPALFRKEKRKKSQFVSHSS
jgi:hypothetical protein